jgi:hypothetical protein
MGALTPGASASGLCRYQDRYVCDVPGAGGEGVAVRPARSAAVSVAMQGAMSLFGRGPGRLPRVRADHGSGRRTPNSAADPVYLARRSASSASPMATATATVAGTSTAPRPDSTLATREGAGADALPLHSTWAGPMSSLHGSPLRVSVAAAGACCGREPAVDAMAGWVHTTASRPSNTAAAAAYSAVDQRADFMIQVLPSGTSATVAGRKAMPPVPAHRFRDCDRSPLLICLLNAEPRGTTACSVWSPTAVR